MTRRMMLRSTAAGIAGVGSLAAGRRPFAAERVNFPVTHTDAEWRRILTRDQYAILREQATERPESSPLDHEFRPGRYDCVGCRQKLFGSETKFDSHTGWPSFWAPMPDAVWTSADTSFGTVRTEVHCANCGGHLGHVFEDGPKPTGLRYCMNGAVLAFTPRIA